MIEKLCIAGLSLLVWSAGCKTSNKKRARSAPSEVTSPATGELDFTLGADDLKLTDKDGTEQDLYYITSPKTLVYAKPSRKSKVIGYLNKGDTVTAEFKKGWVKVNGKGWVPTKFVSSTIDGKKNPSKTAKQLFPE